MNKINIKKLRLRNIFLYLMLLAGSLYDLQAQQLEQYIKLAKEQSPEIKALEAQKKQLSERINELNTLGNTSFGAGYFVSQPETRTGAQVAKLSVQQSFPWFGSFKTQKKYINSLVETKNYDIAIAKDKLALAVATNYYDLYMLKDKTQIYLKNIALIDSYEALALKGVETNQASAVDVLKLQMKRKELISKKEQTQGLFYAKSTAFSNLLNQEDLLIELPDTLSLPKEKLTDFNDPKIHPEVLKYDYVISSIEQEEKVNRKGANPNIGLGLDYVFVEERPGMVMDDNGKDIIMPMVNISIPIFNKKYKSITAQNNIKVQEAQQQQELQKNLIDTQLSQAIEEQISARITYQNQLENLNYAEQAQQILLQQYQNGILQYNDVLDIIELQLTMELSLTEALNNYYRQQATINYLNQ
ncbi:outer membrane protein TolC [Mesonia hippocampi]|uniref:Outer membrane protein TolC n=1 Tax=Mesonia hippocampi TaxID=1628250 RepID=A0A840EUC7_9FLAO|nr:TolC family protein [Mesonia hippocampi]MBB4119066.1 outer membrane protein TolC [Mesonia hippocampi]